MREWTSGAKASGGPLFFVWLQPIRDAGRPAAPARSDGWRGRTARAAPNARPDRPQDATERQRNRSPMSDEDDDIAPDDSSRVEGDFDPDRRFIVENGLAAQIAALAEPVIEAHGFRLVRVLVSNRDGGTVQVMAERAHGQIDVADLTRISRDLSPLMDAHDLIGERYFLEVSSPGIDRPLVRAGDFEDWAGYEAKLKLRQSVEGRRRFRGIVEGFENGEVLLRTRLDDKGEEQVLGFAPSLLEEAKLVMTDELIRAALAGRAAQKADADEGLEIEEEGDEADET